MDLVDAEPLEPENPGRPLWRYGRLRVKLGQVDFINRIESKKNASLTG